MPEPRREFRGFLRFEPVDVPKRTTETLDVRGGTDLWLGTIRWYAPWRRYCFFPNPNTLFDASCLLEIQTKLNALMEDRKRERQR